MEETELDIDLLSDEEEADRMQHKDGSHTQLAEPELQVLRLRINSRERKRMHDLNSALEGLREVMPYANGPSVRKLSKIATLLLARNYILMLQSSVDEMKKLVGDIYQTNRAPPRLASGRPPTAALSPVGLSVSGPAGFVNAPLSAGHLASARPPITLAPAGGVPPLPATFPLLPGLQSVLAYSPSGVLRASVPRARFSPSCSGTGHTYTSCSQCLESMDAIVGDPGRALHPHLMGPTPATLAAMEASKLAYHHGQMIGFTKEKV